MTEKEKLRFTPMDDLFEVELHKAAQDYRDHRRTPFSVSIEKSYTEVRRPLFISSFSADRKNSYMDMVEELGFAIEPAVRSEPSKWEWPSNWVRDDTAEFALPTISIRGEADSIAHNRSSNPFVATASRRYRFSWILLLVLAFAWGIVVGLSVAGIGLGLVAAFVGVLSLGVLAATLFVVGNQNDKRSSA